MSTDYLIAQLATIEALPEDIQEILSRIRQTDLEIQAEMKRTIHRNVVYQFLNKIEMLQTCENQQRPLTESSVIAIKDAVKQIKNLEKEKYLLAEEINDIIEAHSKHVQRARTNYLASNATKPPKADVKSASVSAPTSVEKATTSSAASNTSLSASKKSSAITSATSVSGQSVAASSGLGIGKRKSRPESRKSKQSKASAVEAAQANGANAPNSLSGLATTTARTSSSKKVTDSVAGTSNSTNNIDRKKSKKSFVRNEEQTYCFPGCSGDGDMVACDSPTCDIEWFHYKCVGLNGPPSTKKWYCPKCKQNAEKRR